MMLREALLRQQTRLKVKKPLVVRLVGTNQQEGQKILANAGISVLDSMEEAAKQAVEITRGAQR